MATLNGTAQNDVLDGTGDGDIIRGRRGHDLLSGLSGDDRLLGGGGRDTLIGGAGDDTLDGSAGRDEVSFAGATGEVTADLAAGIASGDGIGTDSLVSIESIRGGSFDDLLIGNGGANWLHGKAGDDELFGNGGKDRLFGAGGSDRLEGGDGRDTLDGGARSDTLVGGAGNDLLVGGARIDTAIFSGSFAEYEFTAMAGGNVRVRHVGGDGSDGRDIVSADVERLVFDDFELARRKGSFSPVARDDAFATEGDATLSGDLFTSNGGGADFDIEGDTLAVFNVDGHKAAVGKSILLASGARLTVNADGTFDYDPNGAFDALRAGETGADFYTYRLGDGTSRSMPAEVTIAVDGVNDAPDAADDAGTVVEPPRVTKTGGDSGTALGNALVNDSDPDLAPGGELAVTGISADGIAFEAVADGLATQAQSAFGTLNITANGAYVYELANNDTIDAIAQGEVATDTFTYRVSDPDGGVSEAEIVVSIFGSNDRPTAIHDAVTTDEETAFAGDVFADNGSGADFDIDGDAFEVSTVEGKDANVGVEFALRSGALLTLNADGTFDYDPNGAFEHLGVGQFSNDFFSYGIADVHGEEGFASVTVTVNGVNDGVTVVTGALSADENQTAAGEVVVDDPDVNDTHSFQITGGADGGLFSIDAGTGVLTFDTAPDFENPGDLDGDNVYEVEIEASDGNGGTDSRTVLVTVADVNDAPVIATTAFDADENQTAVGTVLATDEDASNDTLHFSLLPGLDRDLFSITPEGELIFTRSANFESPSDQGGDGVYQVSVLVQDGRGGNDVETVSVTIRDVNDVPVIATALLNADENQAAAGTVVADDEDEPADTLTFSLTGNGADAAQFAIAPDGTLTFNAAPDFEGRDDADGDNIYEVEVQVTDGEGGSDTRMVQVQVRDANDAPVITTTALAAEENQTAAGMVAVSDQDAGDSHTFALTGNGADAGLFSIDANTGALTFTVAPDFENPGDLDGDGVYEVEVEADDGNGGTGTQLVQVTVDDVQSAPATVPLSQIVAGTAPGVTGFVLEGIDSGDHSGFSVSSAGDVNGDDFDDLLIGAYSADPGGAGYDEGETYLVFGGGDFGTGFDLASLDGTSGFVLAGIDLYDHSGRSVSAAGDVNGDGFADLVIGAPFADPPGTGDGGESYVVFGGEANLAALDGDSDGTIELADLDGINGSVLEGVDASDWSGWSVSSAGDVNGDGFDDLLVGAPHADPSGTGDGGESYVVFGGQPLGANLDLATLDGSNGFVLEGIHSSDRSGASVSSAGDVNGDGIDDLLVGAYQADPGGSNDAGETYLVFGRAFGPGFDLGSLDGTNGYVLEGIDSPDRSGFSVSSAGDVNGDGFADLVVGARSAEGGLVNTDRGETYVVFGGPGNLEALDDADSASRDGVIDLAGLDGTNGFVLNGIANGDQSGFSVSSAGDLNGDGFDDLLVGAPEADPTFSNAGETYVVFGGLAFGASLDLAALDGTDGFAIEGRFFSEQSGRSVSAAGDVNGDGFADLIVGAPTGGAGNSYVIYGGEFSSAAVITGGEGADALTGGAGAQSLVGGRGGDTLSGGGGADVLYGGNGADRLEIADASFFRLDGGGGQDTLVLDGDFDLDLTGIANPKVAGLEAVDITGSGDNVLTLDASDAFSFSAVPNAGHAAGSHNSLVIYGDGGDTVDFAAHGMIAGTWTQAGTIVIDAETFNIVDFADGGDPLASVAVHEDVALVGVI